jgi:hypothetical protein
MMLGFGIRMLKISETNAQLNLYGGFIMKLVSWNVNGIRACIGKGFLDFFKAVSADVFCIQETKVQQGQVQLDMGIIINTGIMP